MAKWRVTADWLIDFDGSDDDFKQRLWLLQQMNSGFLDPVKSDGGSVFGRFRFGLAQVEQEPADD